MTCKPPPGAADKSLHMLSAYGAEPEVWMWLSGGWSKPDNQRWGTKPSGMSALGWRYVGPCGSGEG